MLGAVSDIPQLELGAITVKFAHVKCSSTSAMGIQPQSKLQGGGGPVLLKLSCLLKLSSPFWYWWSLLGLEDSILSRASTFQADVIQVLEDCLAACPSTRAERTNFAGALHHWESSS